jgi:hypothetical protein
MEDRILINGVWYVRETQPEEEIILDDLTQTLNIIYENSDYSWEATRIFKDDGETFYDGFDIEFTDKTKTPWKTEDWDNMRFINGVLENDNHSIKLAGEAMDNEGIKHLKVFLKYLKDKRWF